MTVNQSHQKGNDSDDNHIEEEEDEDYEINSNYLGGGDHRNNNANLASTSDIYDYGRRKSSSASKNYNNDWE